MRNNFLLLRKNKQLGPFSLEELLQQSLTSSDLVWVDGRSAGWQSPQDIDLLRPYLLKKEAGSLNGIDGKQRKTTNEVKNNFASTGTKNAAPSYHSFAKHIYVSLPAGLAVPTSNQTQDDSPSDKLERKADELYRKIQAFANKDNTETKDDLLDTKYTRSLDDIKAEYSNWLYEQSKKKKRAQSRKQLAFAAITLLIITAASGSYWFWKKPFSFKSQPEYIIPAVEKSTVTPKNNSQKKSSFPSSQEPLQQEHFPGSKKQAETGKAETLLPDSEQENLRQGKTITNSSTAAIPSKSPSGNQPNSTEAGTQPNTEPAGTADPTEKITGSSVIQPSAVESKPLSIVDQIQINSRSIKDGNKGKLSGMEVTVKNNSNQLLKVIAVDVFFYKENEKLAQTKTLYFTNIAPRMEITLWAPTTKKSVKASYQLGLVSSDEGKLYVQK